MRYLPNPVYAEMKADWAKKHLDKLRSELALWASDPYTVTEKDDIENGLHIRRFEAKPIREEIGLIVGDFSYALRSGLDQLAWQLALLTTDQPRKKTCFPIHEADDARGEARLREILWDIPCEAGREIRALQPYNRGTTFKDDPLWKLGELCNLDKHRVMPINSTGFQITHNLPAILRRSLEYAEELIVPIAFKDKAQFEPHSPEVIFGEPIDAPGTTFQIREGEITEIYNFVRNDVLRRFLRFFPKSPNP